MSRFNRNDVVLFGQQTTINTSASTSHRRSMPPPVYGLTCLVVTFRQCPVAWWVFVPSFI